MKFLREAFPAKEGELEVSKAILEGTAVVYRRHRREYLGISHLLFDQTIMRAWRGGLEGRVS
jgi:hypothetical protein